MAASKGVIGKQSFCLALLFIMIVPCPLWKSTRSLTGISSDGPPHLYREVSEIKGLKVGILKEILQGTGYGYAPAVMPWKRSAEMVREGDL